MERSKTGDDQYDEEAQIRGVYQISEIADDVGCPFMIEETISFVYQDDKANVTKNGIAMVQNGPELLTEVRVRIATTRRRTDWHNAQLLIQR